MLLRDKHINFIKETLKKRDDLFYLTEFDRLATLFWALNSLKLLKDSFFFEIKQEMLDFTLSCLKKSGGFGPNPKYAANISSTFNALQIFYLYDYSFYCEKTLNFILSLQTQRGSFTFDSYGDSDTRLDCCAVLSIKLLSVMKTHKETLEKTHDNSYLKKTYDNSYLDSPIEESYLNTIGFNKNKFIEHILSCYNPDGGFGQIKGSESHGAQVFCVLSCLKILGCIEIVDKFKIIDFLVNRQLNCGGFSGRVNKKEDVCYSFWVFSSLNLLSAENFIDRSKLLDFILSCQDVDGGFSDRPGNEPDLYHLMFSLASLSLLNQFDLHEINPCFAF